MFACRRAHTRLAVTATVLPAWDTVTSVVQAGAVNILIGAVAFQWIGMGALMLAAPLYRDQMSEKIKWPQMFEALTQGGGVQALPAKQVAAAVRRGAVLVDVRTEDQIERSPLPSATNIPMYRPMSKNDIFSWAKRIVFAWNGKAGTEFDPDWLEKVKASVPKGKKVVLVCNQGGTLETKPGLNQGIPSRSLKGVYYLKDAGYRNVVYLEGGAQRYLKELQ